MSPSNLYQLATMKTLEDSSTGSNEDNASTATSNGDAENVKPEVKHHEWTTHDDLVDIKLDYAVDEVTESCSDLEKAAETSDESTDSDKAKESDEALDNDRSRAHVLAMVEALRANGHFDLDPRLSRRVRDFQFAQSERARKKTSTRFMSSLEIFYHLADIRADILWASDAAWRRENRKPYVSWTDYEEKRQQRSWKHPYLVYLLLISHFCMMLYQFHLSGWSFAPIKQNPLIGPPSSTLLEAGGMNAKDMVDNGSWWRLVSAAFLHGGIIHYLLNDVCIYMFGRLIEINHGASTLFLVYFLPAIAGNVMSALFNPGPIAVGASGGVFGLIGACMADIIVNWNLLFLVFQDRPGMSGWWIKLKCLSLMVFEMSLNWIVGLTPYIDNLAHMGGWIYGFLVGVVILERLPLGFFGHGSGLAKKCGGFLFRFLVAGIIAGSIAFASLKLSQSDGETVPFPEITPYVSCVEFPFWTEEKWWHCDECARKTITANLFKTDDSAVYNRIELDCPDGSMVIGNVTDFGFNLVSNFSPELQGLCRKLC